MQSSGDGCALYVGATIASSNNNSSGTTVTISTLSDIPKLVILIGSCTSNIQNGAGARETFDKTVILSSDGTFRVYGSTTLYREIRISGSSIREYYNRGNGGTSPAYQFTVLYFA